MNSSTILLLAAVALSGVIGGSHANEEAKECLKELEAAYAGLEVPAEVAKLGEDVLAANPDRKGMTLNRLTRGQLKNPAPKLIVRESSGASEEEWNNLLSVCKRFTDQAQERASEISCTDKLSKSIPDLNELIDVIDSNELVSKFDGLDSACRIQAVASEGEACLASANDQMVDLTVPDEVKKLVQDLRALNPDLAGLSLYELDRHDKVNENVKEFTQADDDSWFHLIQSCGRLWAAYTWATREAECGDDIWQVTNSDYNRNLTRMMSSYPELDEIASHVYACTPQVKKWLER